MARSMWDGKEATTGFTASLLGEVQFRNSVRPWSIRMQFFLTLQDASVASQIPSLSEEEASSLRSSRIRQRPLFLIQASLMWMT
ncbi:hypothetical protein BG58_18015 [Caballeronia jiangsuensis]|nr:hypothetical protein BG58_18015 [Caballeronia jiangsuensis]